MVSDWDVISERGVWCGGRSEGSVDSFITGCQSVFI